MLFVRGATLAGMAAAARLARLGHEVTLITDGAPLGQRWAPRPGPRGQIVDDLPAVISLPATWRDLFKKSGAHLVTELNRVGLALVEAPPAEHLLPDGTTLLLPTERGAQFHAISAAYDAATATAWQGLLDELDETWAAYRRFALEGTTAPSKADRSTLRLDRSLADDAATVGPLAALVTAFGEPTSPAIAALPLVVERQFGRWHLVDAAGLPHRASLLVDLLAERLTDRGVRTVDNAPTTHLDTRPHTRHTLLRPAPRPATRPEISHELRDAGGALLPGGIREIVDHRGPAPTRTWLRPTPDGVLATTLAPGTTADPDWGLATRTARDWLRRTPIVDGDALRASACSPAGPEPWAELASAALAVYALHERLTGEDSRPTNKDFRAPRLAQTSTKRD